MLGDNYEDIFYKIRNISKKKNAVILSHYYQESEIQDIADFIGDSLELSKKAASTDADIIVFCGVYFMAEVAKIINPKKKVLLPDINAGCSLATSCKVEDFKKFRQKYSDCVSVTYINSSAEVKSYSDIICTSSNAAKIINQIPKDKTILFAPDKFLGRFLENKTQRKMILWQGSCIVHESFSERELVGLMTKYVNAHVIAHPECPGNLLKYAHFVGSTTQLLKYTADRPGSEFIVLTEEGILHQMKKVSAKSNFYFLKKTDSGCESCSKCPYMRLNTLEKLYDCLLNDFPEVTVEKSVSIMAKKALDAMLIMG
ncbi:quinolinate synthase NadA [Neoehrlichia mikurensis]|uniref:Quinolinate synthase n=1 Tax=Neoehrlichia mikurensis TaxID=89586 RepID=A0A9Q9BVZ0_9RICK|nr:quinolinate synthase NadA [Neoehrlichia mikurensis]QXK92316.1 quinolinate synthase NadA [Neoehrlichia mikurensis]QXK92770.1 quinolinate synthase NadA [Neoehrlichia mikurensis]QXK94011.1 quinolinate synthase NadA [Neoehrlichia mikurensis]UTO55826.1 quinolinate synthase NadA [Neoehrlichia mikurensis]UTO56741.1 quinolinate synthase NadA [Neoehrlichia mikurensis]